MKPVTTHHVNDLDQGDRAAIEHLLGQPLSGDQTVFIMAYPAGVTVDEATRSAARRRLEKHSQSQGANSQDFSGEDADAAVEEAMRHVRPRDA